MTKTPNKRKARKAARGLALARARTISSRGCYEQRPWPVCGGDAADPVCLETRAMTAKDACQCFEMFTLPTLPMHELIGKDVACWRSLDAPCHGDVLLKYAARLKPVSGETGPGSKSGTGEGA